MTEFAEEGKKALSCPLEQHCATLLASLAPQKPFRKRHPILFWFCTVLLIGMVFLLGRPSSQEEDLAKEDALALISIKGPILETEKTLAWIRKVEQTKEIKGVLLRIDSPGGGASASQELYSALKRLAAKKPLVASMGSVAASGGLMVSMAAEKIYANASTITGSIGVRMDIPQVQELLQKVGVSQETLVTGPYKNAGSPVKPLSEKDRAYFQEILNAMHAQFVDIVAQGRKMPKEKAASLATGRIYTGEQALDLGLIDALGGQDEAHAWLCTKTGVQQEQKLIKRPKEQKWYTELLTSLLSLDLTALLSESKEILQKKTPIFLYQ